MGRKKGKAGAPNSATLAAKAPETGKIPGVHFVGYAVLESAFREVEFDADNPPAIKPGQKVGVALNLTSTMRVAEQPDLLLGELILTGEFTCDPKLQPYFIRVSVLGSFRAAFGLTREALEQFLEHAAPSVLFPFMRTVVMQLTGDGRFGPLRLDMVNVAAIMKNAKKEK